MTIRKWFLGLIIDALMNDVQFKQMVLEEIESHGTDIAEAVIDHPKFGQELEREIEDAFHNTSNLIFQDNLDDLERELERGFDDELNKLKDHVDEEIGDVNRDLEKIGDNLNDRLEIVEVKLGFRVPDELPPDPPCGSRFDDPQLSVADPLVGQRMDSADVGEEAPHEDSFPNPPEEETWDQGF